LLEGWGEYTRGSVLPSQSERMKSKETKKRRQRPNDKSGQLTQLQVGDVLGAALVVQARGAVVGHPALAHLAPVHGVGAPRLRHGCGSSVGDGRSRRERGARFCASASAPTPTTLLAWLSRVSVARHAHVHVSAACVRHCLLCYEKDGEAAAGARARLRSRGASSFRRPVRGESQGASESGEGVPGRRRPLRVNVRGWIGWIDVFLWAREGRKTASAPCP